MIERDIRDTIVQRLKLFPAVALLGPRQVGKTTLARTFSNHYFDLEQEEDRLRLDLRWENVTKSSKPVVLDEAQEFPQVFPRLRSAIDRDRKRCGRFLILGSVSPSLSRDISESLLGRIAIVELSPFSIGEIKDTDGEALWLRGGYPDGGILDQCTICLLVELHSLLMVRNVFGFLQKPFVGWVAPTGPLAVCVHS